MSDPLRKQEQLALQLLEFLKDEKSPTDSNEATKITDELETFLRGLLKSLDLNEMPMLQEVLHKVDWDNQNKQFKFLLAHVESLKTNLLAVSKSLAVFEAAKTNAGLPVVKEFIQACPQWKDESGPWGQTLLYVAARNGAFEIVKYLVDQGCDVNVQNRKERSTPLHGASYGSQQGQKACDPIVAYLLTKGASGAINNDHAETPANNAKNSSAQSLFMEQNSKIVWQYQLRDESLEFVNFFPDESSAIEAGFKEKKPSLFWTARGDIYEVQFGTFTRSGKNKSAEGNTSIRRLGPIPDNMLVSSSIQWQYQDKSSAWHPFDPPAQKDLNKAYKGMTPSVMVSAKDPAGTPFDMKVDMVSLCWNLDPAAAAAKVAALSPQLKVDDKWKIPAVRWIMLASKGSKTDKKPKSFADEDLAEVLDDTVLPGKANRSNEDEEAEGDMGNMLADFSLRRREKTDAAPSELLNKIDSNLISKEYTRQASKLAVVQNLILRGAPISASIIDGSTTLVITGTKDQIADLDTLLMLNQDEIAKKVEEEKKKIMAELEAEAKAEEERSKQEAAKRATSTQTTVCALFSSPDMERFVLVNLKKIIAHIKSSDASVTDPPQVIVLEIDEKRIGLEITTTSAKQAAALRNFASLTFDIGLATKKEQKTFDMEVSRRVGAVKQTLATVSHKRSNRDIWAEYLKLFVQEINTNVSDSKSRFEAAIKKVQFDNLVTFVSSQTQDKAVALSNVSKELATISSSALSTILTPDAVLALRNRILESFCKAESEKSIQKTPAAAPKAVDALRKHCKDLIAATISKVAIKAGGANIINKADFEMLPSLLARLQLFIRNFEMATPIFSSSCELLDLIAQNSVVVLSTGTGSGKSTALPALLLAAGYKRVLVTQPRRLPCQMLCDRLSSIFGPDVVGWEVSGDSSNPDNPLLYLTDGLVKERLGHSGLKLLSGIDVIVLDEIHERGVNMDVCVAMLAELVRQQRNSSPAVAGGQPHQTKIVLSSATLDPAVVKPFVTSLGQALVKEFTIPVKCPFSVTPHSKPGFNPVAMVKELAAIKGRTDQILCFLPSVGEVLESCAMFEKIGGGKAYPLHAQQSAADQRVFLEQGSVFFSTNIAETSLTFPSLRYVVDSGLINVAAFDPTTRASVLKTLPAPQSTLSQRKGRLGRTMPGDYFALYSDAVGGPSSSSPQRQQYPLAQISNADLVDVEFSLIRSGQIDGLNAFSKFLPTAPSAAASASARELLILLGILESNGKGISAFGKRVLELPVVGGARLTAAVGAAMFKFQCGRDMLRLSTLLSVLSDGGSALLRNIPPALESGHGDFASLLNIINELVRAHSATKPGQNFNVDAFCQKIGIRHGVHVLRRALKSYIRLDQALQNNPQLLLASQQNSKNWEGVCRSLLAGYGDLAFASQKQLWGTKHYFEKIVLNGHANKRVVALIPSGSKLARKFSQDPVSFAFCQAIVFSPQQPDLAIMSMCGTFEPQWLDDTWHTTRTLTLSSSESGKIASLGLKTASLSGGNNLTLSGKGGAVIREEIAALQAFKTSKTLDLSTEAGADPKIQSNLTTAMKVNHAFLPLIWRWANTKQLESKLDPSTKTFTATGRDQDVDAVFAELRAFLGWLKFCNVFRMADEGVIPRALKKRDPVIEARIARITDPDRTRESVWSSVRGVDATRVSRMEACVWVALTQFDCRVEGGFVRDWVVGGVQKSPPAGTPNLSSIDAQGIVRLHPDYLPSDIDMQLPLFKQFDIDRFVNQLYRIGINVDYIKRDTWRYSLLLDQNAPTGPFGLDLIEPHIVLTHDMIDFDVSNLYCIKDYTREIGMRVDITEEPCCISLDQIVDRIRSKQLMRLRPLDGNMQQRLDKMNKRGWNEVQVLSPAQLKLFTPNRGAKFGATLAALPSSDPLYKLIEKEIARIPNGKVVRMELVSNHNTDKLYEAMSKTIALENNGDPNERTLFHGTDANGAKGIPETGFDDRFWSRGLYGTGAYFADDPNKSNQYTGSSQPRTMFFVKVILGKQNTLAQTNGELVSAGKGFHSVFGTHHATFKEYIVYRYGQAKPVVRITYTC